MIQRTCGLLLFLVFFSITQTAKADTIDYYHVYYNTLKIKQYNLHNINDSASIIVLTLDSIHSGDQLQIRYRNDTDYRNAYATVYLKDAEGRIVAECDTNNNHFVLPIQSILDAYTFTEPPFFRIEYYREYNENQQFRYTLFYVKVE